MCLSDSALSVFETQGHVAAVVEEAQLNAQNFTSSSMLCMFALATVINCCIESYYPVGKDSSPREEWDSLGKMFNCTILPKHHCDGEHIETVHIFCCAVMSQHYLVDRRIPPSKKIILLLCVSLSTILNWNQVSTIFLHNFHNSHPQLLPLPQLLRNQPLLPP